MTASKNKIVVRIPPSPTGNLHVGTARTALYNYLFAKKQGGLIHLRMEDTDKERSKLEFEKNIIEGLEWLGIEPTNKTPIRQSERGELYKKILQQLISENKAYISKETPKNEGDRSEVIRFKNPNNTITFTDLIRGDISFDTTELGDFVIAKSIDEPLYHLAVVADDIDMGVTHVIRGEDHISNTPRQILLIEALGAPRPYYAHIPLILAADRSKMSKRHGATAVTSYRDAGYLPEALINFLALLGWNPGTEQELFSLEELIQAFDLSKVQKGGAIFNNEKLNWFNREYIKKLSPEKRQTLIKEALKAGIKKEISIDDEILHRSDAVITERIATFGEITEQAKIGTYDYLFENPSLVRDKMLFKGEGDFALTATHLETAIKLLKEISTENPTAEEVKAVLMPYAEKEGKGSVLWPIRYSLTGLDRSPDPFTVIALLGITKSINRLMLAAQIALPK